MCVNFRHNNTQALCYLKIINNKDEVETHMNLENVKYDAFISYRHCESDKFVAEQLHKQLESFKIPKSV